MPTTKVRFFIMLKHFKALVFLLTISLSLIILPTAHASLSVDRVEPPFWWSDMAQANLQLMVHGQGLEGIQVESSTPLVTVKKVTVAENPHYVFVDLEISNQLKAGSIELTFLSQSGESKVYPYQIKSRVAGSRQRPGFSSKDVIYLVTPDRFANGDASNDDVDGLMELSDRSKSGGRHGGDLAGLSDSLEYLAELGITKVWLNPIQQNNEPQYSYHGYSISDLYQIDARYGGNQALIEFSQQAQGLGIGLIMDTIPNHIGVNHWWMDDLPSSDWINNDAKFSQTSHSHEAIQDPYSSERDRVEFNDGWFVPTMPDLNQRNPYLANYLIQNNIWWIEFAGLVGLRVDTLPYADKNFTAEFNARILAEYPNLNIVGEEWTTNPAVVSYWQSGKLNQDGYDGGVPSLMDFPLQQALVLALTEPKQGQDRNGLRRLHTLLANDFQYPDANNLVVIGDNHDMSRLHTQLNDDAALTKMALTFLMTIRGIPQLFYGTEILMSNTGSEDHGIIRSDFPGGWSGDKTNAKTGEGLSVEAIEMQSYLRALLNWRKATPAVHHGKLMHYLPKDGVYTFFRYLDGVGGVGDSVVMVVMNNNQSAVSLDLSRFAERIKNKQTMQNVITKESASTSKPLSLPAKSAQVFEIN
ncbi:MAG: cyclomaltodextrinase N-terminal domain-containing protein [Arenicella sp.]|nr:cyclomaltodextrinase N-terminal domain-containing protein [Arenicella sp.]